MRPGHFFSELQRRHVLRVIGGYAFAAWIAVEVYTTIQPILFETAEWSNRLVVILALAGFPLVFILAWVFDITPQGVRRTAAVTDPQLVPQATTSSPPSSTVLLAPRRTLSPRALGFFGLGILVAAGSFAAYTGFDHAARAGAEAPDAATIRSIAVLPFANLSGDGDPDFLSEGIAEELLNRLTQVPDLKVSARTSSFAFQGTNTGVREIGRELGVQAVIDGRVRREGNVVRVTAELTDAATGYVLWRDTFEGEATHVFALQDQISDAIMDQLRLRVTAAPEAGERGTTNARAHELYLLGLQRWHQRTDRDLRQALGYFLNAVTEDPQFALAYAALAQTYAVLPAYGAFPVDTAVVRGSAAAAQAIALDPSLADAYAAMGQLVQNFEWDLHGAERYYQRALEYSNSATAHQWYAETLMLLGRHDEAAEHMAKVLARDALSPIALYIDAYLRTVRGATEPGLVAWRELARLHADFELGLTGYAFSALAAGRTDEAIGAVQRLGALAGGPAQAALYRDIAAALADSGARAAARTAVAAADWLAPSDRAAWQLALGDRTAALRTLEQAVQLHDDVKLPFILVHPLMAPLHADPRFRTLVTETGVGVRG